MSRAVKTAVMVTIMFVGPAVALALLSAPLWVPAVTTDRLEGAAIYAALFFTMLVVGYGPWIIAERMQKRASAKAQRPAGRSVVRSGAGVPAK
jgi:hypothetical protein